MGAGAILAGGASVLGSLFNIGRGKREERRNKRLMQYEQGLNKQMFDYQNAYNTPANQMKRLKEAGLNPALMYGQGTTGNASGAPQTKYTPYSQGEVDTTSIMQGIVQGTQSILQKQQVDNLKAQEKETESRTLLNSIEAAVKGGTKEEAKGLVRYQLENLKSDNKNKLQTLKNLQINEQTLRHGVSKAKYEAESSKLEMLMNSQDWSAMEKNMISRLDPPILRMFLRVYGGATKDIKDLVKLYRKHLLPMMIPIKK